MNKYLRAMRGSFRQEWKQHLGVSDIMHPIFSALGPAIAAGYIVGKSGNEVAISYVFIGSTLMALWSLGVFTTGWSLAGEHFQGTLDLLITTRTPLTLVLLGKALAIMVWLVPSAVVSFVTVLAFSQAVTPVDRPALLLVSSALAIVSVVAFSFIFAPMGFLMGARGGFFNAFVPLGTVMSGFLYPIGLLPVWMEAVARLLPSAWAMDAVVRSVNGSGETWQIFADWGLAIVLCAVFFALATLLFGVSEKQVRVSGNLGRS
jgi:ABC-2 type transport system permease protein